MNDKKQTGKRFPIRKRVLYAILGITLVMMTVALITSMYYMNQMIRESEAMLSAQLSRNLSREVELKALHTETKFESYIRIMEILRHYAEHMYQNHDRLVESGKFIDTSRASTGEGVYALQSAFASEDYDLERYHDEMYFFSHLEYLMEPIAKENDGVMTTVYLGSKSGMMISYDKWSSLSPIPEPDMMIYDFTGREWFQKGMKAEDIIFTNLYTDAMGRGLTITAAVPFKDLNGEVQGVLAADFDITGVYDEMISLDLGSGSSSFAIENDGNVISIDSDKEVPIRDFVHLSSEEVAQMTSGKSGTKDAFYAFSPVGKVNWILCSMVPRTLLMESVETLERSFRTAMLAFQLTSVVLIIAGIYLSNRIAKSITHPIELLVEDMQTIAEGDLDHKAVPHSSDEIGDMAVRLNEMVEQLKETIRDLGKAEERADRMHELANQDALTTVKNKTAFDSYMKSIQDELEQVDEIDFAVILFDCDDLKQINDRYGHDKGDEYLKNASSLICSTFKHSPVFRFGGDEFTVGLRGSDFTAREELINSFRREQEAISRREKDPWKQVHVSLGTATYDPEKDRNIYDTLRRADMSMYEDKEARKENSSW